MESGKTFSANFKKRVYKLDLEIIAVIDKMPNNDFVSRRISDQLLRSATSVLANYIEAQSAISVKELIRYENISLRSANESKLWVALLRDSNRLDKIKADLFLKELDEISKILASSIIALRKKIKTKEEKV